MYHLVVHFSKQYRKKEIITCFLNTRPQNLNGKKNPKKNTRDTATTPFQISNFEYKPAKSAEQQNQIRHIQ